MRTSMRIGRGAWISGGGGVFASIVAFALLRGMMMLAVMLITLASFVALKIIADVTERQRRTQARRYLALEAVQMSVSLSLLGNRQVATSAIGVYVAGPGFFVGPHPSKLHDLRTFYPDRHDGIALVALFPDRPTANAAKRALTRHQFSAAELRGLFVKRPAR